MKIFIEIAMFLDVNLAAILDLDLFPQTDLSIGPKEQLCHFSPLYHILNDFPYAAMFLSVNLPAILENGRFSGFGPVSTNISYI